MMTIKSFISGVLKTQQRKLQGFGHFERLKAHLEHLSFTLGQARDAHWVTTQPGMVFCRQGFISWWLMLISLLTHFQPGLFTIKPLSSCCHSRNVYLWAAGVILAPFLAFCPAAQGCPPSRTQLSVFFRTSLLLLWNVVFKLSKH